MADALWVLCNHVQDGLLINERGNSKSSTYRIKHFGLAPRAELDSPARQMLKQEASATEQETAAGALARPDAGEHVFAFFRELRNPAGMPFAARP